LSVYLFFHLSFFTGLPKKKKERNPYREI